MTVSSTQSGSFLDIESLRLADDEEVESWHSGPDAEQRKHGRHGTEGVIASIQPLILT